MSRPFEGAITTAPDDPDDPDLPPPAERPHRPVIIEFAAAILIVGGISAIMGTVGAAVGGGRAAPTGPILAIELALDILTIAIGLLVRFGRAWLLCINAIAVLVFLEFSAVWNGSTVAMLLAVLDAIGFVAVARHRAWFEWRPETEGQGPGDGRGPG
jgi:hypothetical protein